MSDDLDDEKPKDVATQVQGEEIPIWPNLPGVSVEQRCRAWCLSTSLESIPLTGKPAEIARGAVIAAALFEEYILDGKPGPKLVKE